MDKLNSFSLIISFIYSVLEFRIDCFGYDLSLLNILCGSVLLGLAGYVLYRLTD